MVAGSKIIMKKKDPTSHRIIEKRRRDRMNNCLADLSKLIPAHYMKKGRGRVEKTEIIESAIKHLKDLIEHANAQQQQQHQYHQQQQLNQQQEQHKRIPQHFQNQQQPLQVQPPRNNQQHRQINQQQQHPQSQVTTTSITNGVINSLVQTSSSVLNNSDKAELIGSCSNKLQLTPTPSAKQDGVISTTAWYKKAWLVRSFSRSPQR